MEVMSNIQVYGLEEAIRRSKYPMATDASKPNTDVTSTVKALGSSEMGSGHDNFLCGIVVQFDLTFTIKAWTEAERYHFFDIISSQSTMHRIARFDLDTQYIDYVDERMIAIMKELVDKYNSMTGTEEKTEQYLKILYSNPCGFKLTAGMTTNYRQLKTIVNQRKNHRLPEWRAFCDEVMKLPLFKEICFGGAQ